MRATHRGQVRSSAGGDQAVERLFEHSALPGHHQLTAKGLTKATTGDQVVIQRHLLQVARSTGSKTLESGVDCLAGSC